MKQTAKHALALLALLILAGLFLGVYLSARPQAVPGVKTVTVEVVHGDNSTKTFRFQTEMTYLGPLLLSEELIRGDVGPYGLYITEVDGEVADYSLNKSYWSLFEGNDYASQGADTTPLTDGAVFRLVYTVG